MTTKEFQLKIHEEADLYSPLDPDQNCLSEDVIAYLERNYLNRFSSPGEKNSLRICSDTPVNEKNVRTRIAEYFSGEKDNISREIKRLTRKQICLFAFGIIVLAIWFFLSVKADRIDAVKAEILSITGWVAIWEAASISIMQRPELVALKKKYDRIINGEITFHTGINGKDG